MTCALDGVGRACVPTTSGSGLAQVTAQPTEWALAPGTDEPASGQAPVVPEDAPCTLTWRRPTATRSA